MRSICANSAATRPRFSHTPPRMFSISSGDFSGNAARKFSRPTLCSGNHGPTSRIRPPAKFAMRLRLMRRRTANVPTISQPRTRSKPRLSGSSAFGLLRRAIGRLERHDDLAENLSAFEPLQPFLEFRERHLDIDHGRQPRRHLRQALVHVADGAAERAEDPILLEIQLEQVDLGRLPGSRPAGDEPPAALEAEQRAVERVGSDMLEGDVDAFLSGLLAHDAFEAVAAVINDVIGADRLGLFDLL